MDKTSKISEPNRLKQLGAVGAMCACMSLGTAFAANESKTTAIPMTPHQQQVLGYFGELDVDRDGRLTTDEWNRYRAYMQDAGSRGTVGTDQPLTIGDLEQVDTNGDGYVNYGEVYAAEHPDEPKPSINPSSIREVFEKASFGALDLNGDNRVSVAEAAQGSMLAVDDRAAYDFYGSDKDGDGNLSTDEFGDFQQAVKRRMPVDPVN